MRNGRHYARQHPRSADVWNFCPLLVEMCLVVNTGSVMLTCCFFAVFCMVSWYLLIELIVCYYVGISAKHIIMSDLTMILRLTMYYGLHHEIYYVTFCIRLSNAIWVRDLVLIRLIYYVYYQWSACSHLWVVARRIMIWKMAIVEMFKRMIMVFLY